MVETWWNEWMVDKNQPNQPAQEQVEKKSTNSTQNNETNGFLRWIRCIGWFGCAETNRPLKDWNLSGFAIILFLLSHEIAISDSPSKNFTRFGIELEKAVSVLSSA